MDLLVQKLEVCAFWLYLSNFELILQILGVNIRKNTMNSEGNY